MIVYPDYKNSIYNLVQNIKSTYGLEHGDVLSNLVEYFEMNKKNIIVMVLDGMGKSTIENTLSDTSWIKNNIFDYITSVCPSTTTAAMTTFYSGKTPLEHGWLGWTLYFKEYARILETFLNTDAHTEESVGKINAAKSILGYETIFEQINRNKKKKVQTYSFNPRGIIVAEEPTINVQLDGFEEMVSELIKTSKDEGHKYMMAYWSDPDHTIHLEGCHSTIVKDKMLKIDDELRRLASGLEDTLLIVTADHGLIDIEKKYYINEYKTIDKCLLMPPSVETRCCSFFVKHEKKEIFVREFNKLLGKDFNLLTKAEFLADGYLGIGNAHEKVDDFLGDYIAVATGKAMIKYETNNQVIKRNHKANHAGLLKEEMIVPIVLFTAK